MPDGLPFSPFEVRDDSNPSGDGLSHLNRTKLGGAATLFTLSADKLVALEKEGVIPPEVLFKRVCTVGCEGAFLNIGFTLVFEVFFRCGFFPLASAFLPMVLEFYKV